ncbi:SEL1-like repeat protein [Sphingomonas sp. M1-B02]|uniref:SEL1-like repeat protein n=1 Tax=Sphingomonas sp. M1-B02 TaxID=3114300 RepID=UPI00223FABEF|nr:SEL1-like repeat protein [Sphingomonas sp. S6-11]UZK66357.1 SEL1-like repeat protein [Sphingomonas sp. S6-11]
MASVLLAGEGAAQTRPSASDQELTVRGQRMPGAEAPRSATCEALARDTHFRALFATAAANGVLGPSILLPTRLPRNPDYSAPPRVAPGSPLPALSRQRFGQRIGVVDEASSSVGGSEILSEVTPGDSAGNALNQGNLDTAVAACRSAYTRGGGMSSGITGYFPASSGLSEGYPPHASPEFRVAAAQGRYIAARAFIASRDQTLPMGFALFDQGRYAESLDWFRKAADKLQFREGGDEAALFVGKLYLQGLGAKSDPVEGVKWLKKAATAPFDPINETPVFDPKQPERNTAVGEAAVILANVYLRGFAGIAKDGDEARKWFDRASDVGHIPATKRLGDLYLEGIETPRDARKAVAFYRRAAKLNHPGAQYALAELLYRGEGVKQDRKEALAWYQAAAASEHVDALYALGRAYDLGEGVKADPQLAIGFYKNAALRGSSAAKVAMGTYFYEGTLVAKDDAVARRWFEEGAAAADPDGAFNLAAMVLKGEGGAKDTARALELLRRASAMGHPAAPRAVAALERRVGVLPAR